METIYQNLLNKWKKTGYIGRVKTNYESKAKQICFAAAQNIIKQQNKIHLMSSTSREGTEPFTICQTHEQLRLFSRT